MKSKPIHPLEHKRDAYGFAVRPQHLQRYREYANIYKEEEEERSDRWNIFLEQLTDPAQSPISHLTLDEVAKNDNKMPFQDDITPEKAGNHSEATYEDMLKAEKYDSVEEIPEKMSQMEPVQEKKVHRIQIWSNIRPSLHTIEGMMSIRVKKMGNVSCNGHGADAGKPLQLGEEVRFVKGASEEDSEEEFYDVERSDPVQDVPLGDNASLPVTGGTNNIPPPACNCPWKEELEVLVRGGVPMALRGELWQAFVGVKIRRREKYYQDLLSSECDSGHNKHQEVVSSNEQSKEGFAFHEKYKGQIEKDLPRTFPGHPALDEDGRNALRRLLIAYARHNPSVGYCQAMNFFAGLLLLLMPEENAFWALLGILDDYFDGYYSEDMIECQVDQLVFEVLVRERFPKLVNHLDYLGVQIAWVTGPWFLSIFMNMLPWETVLRVWDVLLFEGSRVMLFRTALALMELYGPALVTTKDAGDAVTLLQSLAGSTFDSSQLVLTACMGFQNVNEARLKELRDKHRPAVMVAIEERLKGLYALQNSKVLASKLYTFKNNTVSSIIQPHKSKIADEQSNGDTTHLESGSTTPDEYAVSLAGDVEVDPGLDLQEQVIWLKVELCKLLEEKCSAELRAEELEAALMEMVKLDNRRQLSARVEQLEQEASDLRRAFSDKQEQERAMLQVLMRVEQEQKVTEDARRYAEQDAAVQRHTSQILQDKYEEALASLDEMEKRAIMAESMLEATLQYQSGQVKAQASPRSVQNESPSGRNNHELAPEIPARKVSLLSRPFGLGWRNRNKEKPNTTEDLNEAKSPTEEALNPAVQQKETVLIHKEQEQHQPTEG